jgi:NAD(P)-dependent dehydrogenase (short-subunit alcohol dehydrogenase family)
MGQAIARALIRDGNFVIGLDIKAQGQSFDASKYRHLIVDLTKADEIDRAFTEIENEFGQ